MISLFYPALLLLISISSLASQNYARFGVGSCFSHYKNDLILKTMHKESFDRVLFLGDIPYSNYKKYGQSFKSLNSAYDEISNEPSFKNILDSTPVDAIWDDHDYGIHDGGKRNEFKKEAQSAYLDLYRVPKNDKRRSREGVYFSRKMNLGNKSAKFIYLDTRYFRDDLLPGVGGLKRYRPDFQHKDKTMLGSDQWAWLEKELSEEVDFLVLSSSIQVMATNHSFEKWHNLPYERERLLNLVNQSKAKKKLILSGDRHFSAIYKWASCDTCQPIWEATVSGLNKTLSSNIKLHMDPLQIFKGIRVGNYLSLGLNKKKNQVVLDFKDTQGKSIYRQLL